MLSELLLKICWESDFFSSYYFSFSSSFILHSKMSWINKEKIMYSRLQETVNYYTWRLNMISLFKKKETYEVVISEESKSAQPAYSKKLTKMQFKDRLIADHAAVWAVAQTVSLTDSMMMTSQSEESIIIAEASASQSLSESLILTWDDIKNLYQSHKKEWEDYHRWIILNCKTYDIMWRHTEESCQLSLEIRMSFETWSAVENLYQVIMYASVVEVYSKIHDQQSEIYKTKTVFISVIQQTISKYCELADIDSICCMRKEKLLILYQALDSEFYHLKKQIKIMKLTDINSEKMRSLINNHILQIIKLSTLIIIIILSSVNLVNKNKWKSSQDE